MSAAVVAVRERPILMSGEMVRAILEGRKTQTRRVVTPPPQHRMVHGVAGLTIGMNPADDGAVWYDADGIHPGTERRCPYGAPLDRLWVRETFVDMRLPEYPARGLGVLYAADCPRGTPAGVRGGWRPSIFMPRDCSRITLELIDVRVQRLQEISEEDAIAEGCSTEYSDFTWCHDPACEGKHRGALWHFQSLWNSINVARGYGWDVNPWVWCLSFRRVA